MPRRFNLGDQIVDTNRLPVFNFSEDGRELIMRFAVISEPVPITNLAQRRDHEKIYCDVIELPGGNIYSSNLKASLVRRSDGSTAVLQVEADLNTKVPGTGG